MKQPNGKFEQVTVGTAKLALWFNKVTDSEFKSFNSISATMYAHYDKILNYFNNRSTNASAESFNAKSRLSDQPKEE